MQEITSRAGSTSVRLDTEHLLRQMALRGWNQLDLAREAEISQPTVSAAARGETVSIKTARAIHEAFKKHPPTLGDLVAAS
jgi:transcriptional regulator with XRE-family HTH domain